MATNYTQEDMYDEVVAALDAGDGLEGFDDVTLIEVAEACDHRMQMVAAVDVWGNIIDVAPVNYDETRMVQRGITSELWHRFRM